MKHTNIADLHLVPNKMNVHLNVFRTAVLDWIGGEVHHGNIVAVDDHRPINGLMEILQELTNPTTFSNNMSNSTIFRFSTRPGHCCLAFGGPRDEVVSQKDAETGGGTSGVGATGPVGVGVSD
jgi:hypothetical protein